MTIDQRPTNQAYVESHEGEYITPIDAIKSRAIADVLNVADAFKAIGATDAHIDAAVKFNADKAQKEFEAKQAEDPLRRIAELLPKCAVEGRDADLIAACIQNMEQIRSSWKIRLDGERASARTRGQDFSPEETIRDIRQNAPSWVDRDDNGDTRISIDILTGLIIPKAGEKERSWSDEHVTPSPACVENVLRTIGALKPGETTGDIMRLPSPANAGKNQPSYEYYNRKAEHLPTIIQGSDATFYDSQKRVAVSFSVEQLLKLIDFPASV